jgi:hypothetical protein
VLLVDPLPTPLEEFAADGFTHIEALFLVITKVTGVTPAIPHLSHPNAHAIIVSREGQTPVQETREAINEALVK